jgi:Raf kinase inhibitor-like YbhB/YbcL family protein
MLAKIVTGRMTNRLGLWLFGVVVAALLGVVATPAGMSAALPGPEFVLSSPDAQLAVSVPLVYTANRFGCTGGNKSPALQWSGAPAGTKSFVLTLFDPDEKSTPSGWWHWVVYDLPASVDKLAIGAGAEHGSLLPSGARMGRTDLGNDAYHGPCPDKGDPPHRYTFTIYALSVAKLDVAPSSSGAMVVSTAQDHLLGKAVFVAHYGR